MNTDAVLFECFAGNDVTVRLTLANDDGTPVDLTGATLFLTAKVRATDTDAEAIFAKTWDTHADPTGGVTEVEIGRDAISDVGRWVADIQIKDAGGKIRTLAKGYVVIKQRVTTRTA
jgi:hypothetical protein